MLESTYRPGTLTMLECRFNKTTHHVIIIVKGVDWRYPAMVWRISLDCDGVPLQFLQEQLDLIKA